MTGKRGSVLGLAMGQRERDPGRAPAGDPGGGKARARVSAPCSAHGEAGPAEPFGPETGLRSQRSVLYASRSCISLVLTGRFPRTRPLCTAHSGYWVVTLRLREGGGLSKVNTPTNGAPPGPAPLKLNVLTASLSQPFTLNLPTSLV